jgi:hypothetical protein
VKISTTFERGGQAVAAWRRNRLVAAGYGLPAARRLGRDTRYDLHALLDLGERGCPPEVAERILAPLEEAEAT